MKRDPLHQKLRNALYLTGYDWLMILSFVKFKSSTSPKITVQKDVVYGGLKIAFPIEKNGEITADGFGAMHKAIPSNLCKVFREFI